MKIRRVEIRNFRGIEALDLDFTHPSGNTLDLAILAGPNGCGKTSVLEACIAALGRTELLGNRSERDMDVKAGAEDYSIKLLLEHEGRNLEPLVKNKKSSTLESYYNSSLLLNSKIDYFSSWREPKLVGSVSVTARKKGKKPTATESNRLWITKQYLVNLTARRAFEAQDIIDELFEDPFMRINKGWNFFYPQRNEQFIVKPVSKNIDEGFDLYLSSPSSNHLIPVDALSSGEIEILTMLGWFAIGNYAEGVVFIDEPELHLHPAWHRAILRALRAVLPKTQIICATHSTEILDSAYSYERFTLLPEDDPRIRMAKVV